jgi:hypothetical protein
MQNAQGTGGLLDRREASRFLTERGYRVAVSTLAKLAVTGGGPPFTSWGRTEPKRPGGRGGYGRPLYEESALLRWAEGRRTGPRQSTSDLGSGAVAA